MQASSPYDALCEVVRHSAEAAGAVVIVIRGNHGSGYSIRADPLFPAIAPVLPDILRDLALQLDTEMGRKQVARDIRKVRF